MANNVFLYKDRKEAVAKDRDCVKYMVVRDFSKLVCGHYFARIGLDGACFCMRFDFAGLDFDNIDTILTKEDFQVIAAYNKTVDELGYSITEGDERYQIGVEASKTLIPILEKLQSEENKALFERVIAEEIEFMKAEYNLSAKDIQTIYNAVEENSNTGYRDRAILTYVFKNVSEMVKEEAFSQGYTGNREEMKEFKEDLLSSGRFLKLTKGRIALVEIY